MSQFNFGPADKQIADFSGATSALDGARGLVPAPSAGDEDKVLMGDGTWDLPEISGAKVIEIQLDPIVGGNGAYEHTTIDNHVTSDMKVMTAEYSNPAAFNAKVEFTCNDGSIKVSCADTYGTSTIKVGVLKSVPQDPEHITSEEYDILNNRINAINPQASTGVFADIPFAIAASQWTTSNGVYVYVYNNDLLKSGSGVDMIWNDSLRTAVSGDVSAEKSTGYVTFTTTHEPMGELSGVIRIIDNISGILPVAKGGTSAITPSGARLNLNTPIRDIYCDFGLVASLPQTHYDTDITADMVAFDAVFSNPAAIPSGIDVTFAAGSVTITGTLVSGAETNISFYCHEKRLVAEGSEAPEGTQRVADYVQVNPQSLSAAQKTQVQTNLGLGDAATKGIANNLTTEDEGYALDARQGKILNDHIAQSETIQEIEITRTTSSKVTYATNIHIYKMGKFYRVACDNLEISGLSAWETITLASYPSLGLNRSGYFPVVNQKGAPSYLRLDFTDTALIIRNWWSNNLGNMALAFDGIVF